MHLVTRLRMQVSGSAVASRPPLTGSSRLWVDHHILKRFALSQHWDRTEDDDGNGAVETPKAIVKKPSPSPAAKAPKAEPGVYVITFRKFKGKTLNQCSKEELIITQRGLMANAKRTPKSTPLK